MKFSPIASAVLAGMLAFGSANAAEYDLGSVSVGVPKSFGGLVANGPFIDAFKFSLPDNGGSGYAVSDFTLLNPFGFQTAFSALALLSAGPDQMYFTGDDQLLKDVSGTDLGELTMTFGGTPAGNYYITVSGVGVGASGGIYNGAISVSAVPEPETYAMMLAGLGAVGFVAARRRRQG